MLSNMGQLAGETAVLPVLDVPGKGGVAEVQPDRFDQDDFDATAYINELFPTGTRVLCYDVYKLCRVQPNHSHVRI